MPIQNLPVRNFVVEWRYAANLGVYSKMDGLGIEVADEYPDWYRTPLTLELANKKSRRRFFMSFRRCFYDVIRPEDGVVASELDRATKIFDRFRDGLKITRIERVGIRQWLAFESDEKLADLVRRAADKFHPSHEELHRAISGEIEDIGYSVDIGHPAGWKFSLRAGPMEKSQWFDVVPHEMRLFGGPAELLQFKEEFPERFLYVDIDCHKEDVLTKDSLDFVREAQTTAGEVAMAIYKFFRS